MQSFKFSAAHRPSTPKAPTPSPALLALQDQGFELPTNRRPSTQSLVTSDQLLRISPLSISSTPSDLDKPLPLEPHEKSRRTSSLYSADTTVTKIVHLYTNKSQQSLDSSTTDEVNTLSEDDSANDQPPPPTFHQPIAYRDTLVPLLQHQNNSDNLCLSPMPSPPSFTSSLPSLPIVLGSKTSLQATPDSMRGTHEVNNLLQIDNRLDSHFSLQSEGPSSPSRLLDEDKKPIEIKSSSQTSESRINSISPMSKEREGSWYDQSISPVSPSENGHDESQSFAEISRSTTSSDEVLGSINYQRQLAYDALCPPPPRSSPNARVVVLTHEELLPNPISTTVRNVVDKSLVPSPLNLSRSSSRSLCSFAMAGSSQEKVREFDNILQTSESDMEPLQSSELQVQHKPSIGSVNTVWPAPQTPQSPSSTHHRQISGSPKLIDQLEVLPTFSKQIRARIKEKFNKRKGNKREEIMLQSSSDCGSLVSMSKRRRRGQSVKGFVALEYPSNSKNQAREDFSLDRIRKMSIGGGSVVSEPGPAVPSSPSRPVEKHNTKSADFVYFPHYTLQSKEAKVPSIRLHTWDQTDDVEKLRMRNRKKLKEEHIIAKRAAALENIRGQHRAARPSSASILSRASNCSVQHQQMSGDDFMETIRRQNDIREESKTPKNKQVRKIFRSSEERRRDKLKHSIIVVGKGRPISHDVACARGAINEDEGFF